MKYISLFLFLFLACSEPVSVVKHKPVIRSITLSRTQIYVDEFITVQADVADEDKDELSYTWSADGGIFINPKNNPTQWHAKTEPGTYTINLSVTDGTFIVEKATQVQVISHKLILSNRP